MNKSKLQQELTSKIKPGIKPSDLKKQKKNSQFNQQLATPPDSPILKPVKTNNSPSPIVQDTIPLPQGRPNGRGVKDQIKDLQSALQKQHEVVITQQKKLTQSEERIKDLEEKLAQSVPKPSQVKPPEKPPQQTFSCSDCNQAKPHQELSRQFAHHSFCRSCSVKARKAAERQIQEQPIQFTCHTCEKNHHQVPTKMKLDQTLQEYLICSTCRPNVKEFNEADLITDELWQKYPYSSASEILEKEFGIKRRSE
ncbi:hypothetical protein [endosymbiont GvMRE of Glomus versiforme]|uniref:hypothetical protein n=1 Tax=endosymbiont GvMRE of Glomus versiforme TaxID=2039283 RepID=UPI000EB8CA2F|nr:hypothetical protein [endosymbiont GvMRE of Glomus versiforme]RHZ35807.1 hypothetical protein GvMRE_Ic5g11 [endosymbiont GvMRE of Glomus versiforme]